MKARKRSNDSSLRGDGTVRTKNFAHRGYSGSYPENTMLAFEQAYEAGADGIELDVRLTKDKKVVIFHDEYVDRLTEGRGKVNSFTLKELQAFKVNDPLLSDSKAQTIPTLAEYLKWVKDKPLLTNIELKMKDETDRELEDQVAEVIHEAGIQKRLIVSSFFHERLARFASRLPSVQTALLVPHFDEQVVEDATHLQVDFIHLKKDSVTEEVVQAAHKNGKAISTWTINEPEELKKLNPLLLFAIITDFPNRLKAIQDETDSEDAGIQ